MPTNNSAIRTRLQKILIEAFDLGGLEVLVREHLQALGAKLDVIVPINERLEMVAFKLIEAVEQRSLVEQLVRGIQAMRGDRSDVRELAAELGMASTDKVVPVPLPELLVAVKENVIRFNERFAQRREQFRYLSGLKNLHETLHKLQVDRVAITQAAERFQQDPADALEIVVIGDELQENQKAAETSRSLLEDPSDASWVDSFGLAVQSFNESVAKKDLAALARAVEVLKALPSQQAGLNKDLVRCARRLKPMELVSLMDQSLAGLTSGGANAPGFVAEFRDRLNRFRSLCDSLSGLILDHVAVHRCCCGYPRHSQGKEPCAK
ncbi:MAG TPA: effector-associated domain EAD1-containing protein, partial [Isosphaeraceae bacterium]|nr:effector-associated domain EAD1-containing protein [Isosphaeraceae bacterium]